MSELRHHVISGRSVVAPLALIALLALGGSAFAQDASIETKVDRQKIQLSDEVELTISVKGAFEEFQQPTIDGFDVVSQSVQQVLSNRTRSISRTFTLRPQKTGTLTIGAARLTIGGRVVAEAPPISVVVEEPKAAAPVEASDAQDLARMAGEAAFIRYAVPRTRFYVGEPFPLTLELWLQEGLGYAGAEMVQPAKLDGLLVEDLPQRADGRGAVRAIGDQRYQTYDLSVVLATPLHSGKVLVDGATLRVGVARDNWPLSSQKVSRTTQPFNLEIRDVPTEGRPAAFRPSNIGSFTMKGKLADDRGQVPTRARTGQRMVLSVEVAGKGNLTALAAPVITPSEGFEVAPLPAGGGDDVKKDEGGVSGTRVFQWLLTPKQPGNRKTPDVALAWWDPEAERFQEAKIPGQVLEVTGAAVSTAAADASSIGEDVGPIVESAPLTGKHATPPAESPLYWIALGLPLAGFVAVEWRWRRQLNDKKHPGQRLAKGAGANAKKRLRAAEQALKDGLVKDFYGQLSRTLTSYLEERANIPATGMTHDQVRAAAVKAGYPADLVDGVVVEMENCDFARFAPSGSAADKMREAHARVSSVLDQLDRVQPERRP